MNVSKLIEQKLRKLFMDDETQHIDKPDSKLQAESQLMNVSIRGWIVLIVMITICYMEIHKIGICEPLYSMSLLMIGFYFGDKNKTTSGNGTVTK